MKQTSNYAPFIREVKKNMREDEWRYLTETRSIILYKKQILEVPHHMHKLRERKRLPITKEGSHIEEF